MSAAAARALAKLSTMILPDTRLRNPPGHYYSPICSVKESAEYTSRVRTSNLPEVDDAAVFGMFQRLAAHFPDIVLPEEPTADRRYYSQIMFGTGDAVLLSAFIREIRPARVIEVGSGFSSACALDTVDDLGLSAQFTFIEPYPEDRLDGLLRPADRKRVNVHKARVQDVDLGVFESLEAGDLLFLDTTHVSKTGSDVNHELFCILPMLKSGVYIHFHDMFWGWEYPEAWIKENRSWNELYLVRAFLMHNDAYEVVMFNDMMYQLHGDELRAATPYLAGQNKAGGGLYLRKR